VSVGFGFRVDIRPYTGYGDPSLPIATWIAQAGAVGDASGGVLNMTFPFQRDDDAQISELFNLETIAADTSTSVGREAILESFNMDTLAPNRPASNKFWRFRLNDASGISGFAAMDMDVANTLPFWLGSPNRVEGDSGLRVRFANIDLLLYAVDLQGYIWGPRSVLADGGPRRPVGGLFGRG